MAGLLAGSTAAETIEIPTGGSHSIGTAGSEIIVSDMYTGVGSLVIQAGTVKYTSASPTTTVTVGTTEVKSKVVIPQTTIQSGATLVFEDTITPLTTGTSAYTINAGGTLRLVNTAGSENHNVDNSFSNYGGKTTINGAGTLEKTGAGHIALLNNGTAAGSVTVAQDVGGWIDVKAGKLINGGWGSVINWADNKGSINLANGTILNLWDGYTITIDSLTGSGTVTRGGLTVGIANNEDNATYGVANNTATFSGVIQDGTKTGSLSKVGTGTQVLTGANTYTGETTVSGGTLQIGAGGTTGTLGTGAVTIGDGATLAFNRSDGGAIANAITNKGTIDIQKGIYVLNGLTDNTTGKYHVSSDGGLSIASRAMLANTTAETGGRLMLGVDQTGANGWTVAEISNLRNTGTAAYGVYNPSGSIVGDSLLTGTQKLYTSGLGTINLTEANTTFTGGIDVQQGNFALTQNAAINNSCPITVQAAGDFIYDYGAGTETAIQNTISGQGSLIIQSGTVKYTSASPTTAHTIMYSSTTATVNSRVDIAQTTIKSGAVLQFDEKIMPLSTGTTAYTIESGGVLRLYDSSSSESHNADNSFSYYGGKTTINGAGTLEKTGAGSVALLNNGTAAGSVTVSQDVGGWIDVKEGKLINGGWSGNINWANNKGSINLANGTSLNLWDGNTITIDSLTGSGTVTRGGLTVGIANNANNEKYGVANNTATFSGVIQNGAKTGSLNKVGTGTQILSGNNTYTGETKISGGTLQIGTGGTTGTLGTGAVTVSGPGTLAYNRSDDITAPAIAGNGTVANMSASTLTVDAALAPNVSLRADTGATVIYQAADNTSKTMSGSLTGAGTIHFTGANTEWDFSSANISNSGKTVFDGGTITAPSYAQFGKLSTTEDLTWNLSGPSESWTVTMYTDATAHGKITPWTAYASSKDLGTSVDMLIVNGTNTAELAHITAHASAVSYATTVYLPEAVTLEMSGSYDDWAGIFVKKLANVDGSGAGSFDWQTLLPYADSNCGRVTLTGDSAKTLKAGYYLFDVRVADDGGSAYANAAALVDLSGKRLGIGIREKGDTAATGEVYYDLSIKEDGSVGLPGNKILTYSPTPVIATDFEIAEGKTLKVDIANKEYVSLAIHSDVFGEGTLELVNSTGEARPYEYNGTVEGSLSIGENVLLTGSGILDGNLTLQPGSVFSIELDDLEGEPDWTVGGDLIVEENATIEIHSEIAPEILETVDLLDMTVGTSDIIGAENLTVKFDLPPGVIGITQFNAETGAFQAVLGTSASIPEPSTWALLVLGVAGLFVLRKKRA